MNNQSSQEVDPSQSNNPATNNQSSNSTHQIVTYERIGGPQSFAAAGGEPQINDPALYNIKGATVPIKGSQFDNPSNQKSPEAQ